MTMRTDYNWNPPPYTEEEKTALEDFEPSGVVDLRVLETGDAPEEVLALARRWKASFKDWENGAKDRPWTCLSYTAYQELKLFDGARLSMRDLPGVVTARFQLDRETAMRLGGPVPAYEMRNAVVWEATE